MLALQFLYGYSILSTRKIESFRKELEFQVLLVDGTLILSFAANGTSHSWHNIVAKNKFNINAIIPVITD